MRFSERVGFKPIKNTIQINSMDTELRNSLWNALVTFYWGQIPINTYFNYFKRENISVNCMTAKTNLLV
jgi:hypothetical protein